MVGVYGPRQSERKVGYSEQGRISVDVKLATFATRQRGVFGQVGAVVDLLVLVMLLLIVHQRWM